MDLWHLSIIELGLDHQQISNFCMTFIVCLSYHQQISSYMYEMYALELMKIVLVSPLMMHLIGFHELENTQKF